eukprot:TRINITY_DN23594_c0_g1_i1.p1 TRINITY_DN23594_c0_g1~~TRINITY_DN23594_c0_g1_i1.p1  ORF type:complete len:151 (-),score=28.26 TRINITY_DN23594_c0_g1_i1:60-512(-)
MAEATSAQGNLDRLRQRLDAELGTSSSLARTKNEIEAEINRCRQSEAGLRQQIGTLRQKKAETQAESAREKGFKVQTEASLRVAQAEAGRLDEQVRQKEVECKALETRVANLGRSEGELKSEISKTTREIDAKGKKLQEKKTQVLSLIHI